VGVGGALLNEGESCTGHMETIQAGSLSPVVVRVPASGGVEKAEGIGEMKLSGEIGESGCCDAFCAAAWVG